MSATVWSGWPTKARAARTRSDTTAARPYRISLSMSGDQANAVFISASPEVREALENAMPRLREILADAGVTLGRHKSARIAPGINKWPRKRG